MNQVQLEKKQPLGDNPITKRIRRTIRCLYQLRSFRTAQAMRRIILGTLFLLGVVTTISLVNTQRHIHLQQQVKREQQKELLAGRTDETTTRHIVRLEETSDFTSDIVQISFYFQSSLTAALFLLCYLYFIGDRAERNRQERKLRNVNRRLSRLVEIDGLTELKNRRAFEERLREEWERARRYNEPLSVLLLDVDSFKKYNDSFGHLAGDTALKMVAEVLRRQARKNDFAARYGGEEFVVLLPHTPATAAVVAAERMRVAFLATDWPEVPVTASIGVATMHKETENPEQLVNEADLALYYAKYTGRNRVIHVRDAILPSGS